MVFESPASHSRAARPRVRPFPGAPAGASARRSGRNGSSAPETSPGHRSSSGCASAPRCPWRGLSGFRYEILPVEIDEVLLNDIATTTGGRYFRAKDSEALKRILTTIDGLEKSPVRMIRYVHYDELTRPLVLLGMAALAVELLLSATLVIRIP